MQHKQEKTEFGIENIMVRGHLGYQGKDSRKLLKCIKEKQIIKFQNS
jgi:hypothetical protein